MQLMKVYVHPLKLKLHEPLISEKSIQKSLIINERLIERSHAIYITRIVSKTISDLKEAI